MATQNSAPANNSPPAMLSLTLTTSRIPASIARISPPRLSWLRRTASHPCLSGPVARQSYRVRKYLSVQQPPLKASVRKLPKYGGSSSYHVPT